MPYSSCAVYSSQVHLQFFYPDDGIRFYRNVCEMIANILAVIFLLKSSSDNRRFEKPAFFCTLL